MNPFGPQDLRLNKRAWKLSIDSPYCMW